MSKGLSNSIFVAVALLVISTETMLAGSQTECGDLFLDSTTHLSRRFQIADSDPLLNSRDSERAGQLDAWSKKIVSSVSAGKPSARDLVIYVHGFKTPRELVQCQALAIERSLESLDRYKNSGVDPNMIAFLWPGDLAAWRFSQAQSVAAKASIPLSSLLMEALQSPNVEKIILIAHSLGAQVAMDALLNLDGIGVRPSSIEAVLLVQGAIPAVSIRSWSGEMEIRYPSLEAWCLVKDDIECRPPIVFQYGSGVGKYFEAIRVAKNLIITTAERDMTLRRWYGLDELHRPNDPWRPSTTTVPGRLFPKSEVEALAIGNPFHVVRAYDIFSPTMNPTLEQPFEDKNEDFKDPSLEIHPNPNGVYQQTTVTYSFELTHPGYREIELESLAPPDEWHSPLASAETRYDLLKKAWDIIRDQKE